MAQGIISSLIGNRITLDLVGAIDSVAAELPVEVSGESKTEVLSFIRRRLEGQLREAGHAADVVSAVLAVQGHDPSAAAVAVRQLEEHVSAPGWPVTLAAYSRCARIVRGEPGSAATVDTTLFERPAESRLHAAVESAVGELDLDNLDAVMAALAVLAPVIHTYFDEVLVMADDLSMRANRLAEVRRIAQLPRRVADMTRLEGF